jgi:hypothetical protein
LIEESRQNLLTYSEDTNSYSNIDFSTVTTNQVTAPDGTLTGDVLTSTKTGGSNNCWVQKAQTISANTSTYVMSVFLKAGNTTQSLINLQLTGGTYQQSRATINWTTNTISSGDGTATLTAYPNGWYRASLTLTNNETNTGVYPRVYVKSQGTNNINGEYVYIWGWQVEAGAFPTSYIPTDSTPGGKIRNPDNASMTGTNFSSWYNQSEGTIFANTRVNGVQTGRYDRLWAITNSNLNLEGISLFVAGPVGVSGAYVSSVTITNSATEQINGALVESALTTPRLKSAFSFKTNDCASAYNGILRFVDKSAILLSNPDRLLIGQPQRYQGTSCMTISRLTYYPRALKPNQLQYLTQ